MVSGAAEVGSRELGTAPGRAQVGQGSTGEFPAGWRLRAVFRKLGKHMTSRRPRTSERLTFACINSTTYVKVDGYDRIIALCPVALSIIH